MRLCETLRAQQEARGQHEQFHNILNRAPEPFSVVAEHFGRGLFNKIVIVDDDVAGADDQAGDEQIVVTRTRKPTPAKTPTAPISTAYGPGAEAKIRLQEGGKGRNQPFQAVTSEGRLRMEERKATNRDTYNSSLTANLTWPKPPNEPVAPMIRPSTKISANLSNASKPAAATAPSNPFDEEDDEKDTKYDEAKNPFDENDDEIAYDDKLNPFA
jgi:vacuolar protein sorting-associated protein 11